MNSKKSKKRDTSKRNIKSFEADDDVNEMIEIAEAHGLTLKDLVNASVRKYGHEHFSENAKRLRAAADSIESSLEKLARKNTSSGNR